MSMDSVAVDVDNPIGGEMCAEGSLSSTMSFEVEEEFEAAVGQSMQDMFSAPPCPPTHAFPTVLKYWAY